MNADCGRSARDRRDLWIFLAATFAWSWAWWGTLWLNGQQVAPGSTATHLPGLAGPLVGATVVALVRGGAAFRAFLASLVRRPAQLAIALVLLCAPLAVALAAWGMTGQPAAEAMFAYPGTSPGWSPLLVVLAVVILNGLGEEAGWRGFLFDRLSRDHGPLRAALLVVLPWALWHAPLFVVHAGMAAMRGGPVLLGWLAGLAAASFVLGWLYRWSGGSVLFVAVWHSLFNFASATPPMAGIPAAAASTAVMLAAVPVWLTWRRIRPPA